MKFIKAITLTLVGFSSQVLSTTASAPIDQFDEEQSRGRSLTKAAKLFKEPMLFRAESKAEKIPTPTTNYYQESFTPKALKELPTTNYYQQTQSGQPMANPDNCPAPSRRQVIGNQCLGPNQVPTVCCGRNKRRSYVACMPVNLQTCFTGGRGSQNFATSTTTLSALPHYVKMDTKASKELPTTNYYQQTQGGQSMANPDNCPAPSRRQVIGNQCLGPNQVPTVCCGRNKRRSYVACMPVDLQTCFKGGRGNSGHGADIEFHSDSDSATLSLSAVSEQPKPNASSFPCHNVAGRCFS
jgi:hypothetical protein